MVKSQDVHSVIHEQMCGFSSQGYGLPTWLRGKTCLQPHTSYQCYVEVSMSASLRSKGFTLTNEQKQNPLNILKVCTGLHFIMHEDLQLANAKKKTIYSFIRTNAWGYWDGIGINKTSIAWPLYLFFFPCTYIGVGPCKDRDIPGIYLQV